MGCSGGSSTDAPEDPCDHHKLSSQQPHQHFLATALTVCVNRHTGFEVSFKMRIIPLLMDRSHRICQNTQQGQYSWSKLFLHVHNEDGRDFQKLHVFLTTVAVDKAQ